MSVADSEDSNLQDEEVFQEANSKLELSAVAEEDGDFSIVLCQSIALSPFRDMDIPGEEESNIIEVCPFSIVKRKICFCVIINF